MTITTQKELDAIVERRLKQIRKVLTQKSKEYTDEGDRLSNFRKAGAMQGIGPEQALVGMWAKHVISITELAVWAETGDPRLTLEIIDEKIVDSMNYMVLLEALFRERFPKEVSTKFEFIGTTLKGEQVDLNSEGECTLHFEAKSKKDS